ncbi:mechanosensitive ion channel family protein [Sphingobium sp. EP60837]|uniref:mechanosensitive ion channel family protein n=1 Tax=Sphingobium sp. EP60837 TaxID=1855519 RepID=UPI0007DD2272|nr:mechanosensitive ion channel family protein [Sphingobium sp. EP60837]ANI79510.1 Small-conductance mechanosensitive channel [Sphingobium sp. EP60837]
MDTVNILLRQLVRMWQGFVAAIPSIIIALAIIMLTWLAARYAKRIADRLTAQVNLRPSLKELIDTIVSIAIWIVGLLIAATVVLPGLTPASLVAGLGIGTIAIGFAFQDFFQNFLSGIIIMVRKKMRIGDVIECEGIIGRVEHISLRETHLRKLSNELTIVPNSTLFKNPVEILTDGAERRHEIVVGIAYDADLDLAAAVLRKAVEGVEQVSKERPVDIFAQEFSASSVDFTVRWWAGSKPSDMHASRDAVIRAIKRALDDAGIEIPYPYVTNIFKEPMPIQPVPNGPSKGEESA